jgi:methylthioribose-1-phosphate isomerase
LKDHLEHILSFLYTSRPTAVNLGTAIKRLRAKLEELIQSSVEGQEATNIIIKEAKLVAEEDVGRNQLMSKHGAEWLLEDIAKNGRQLEKGGVNV